MKRQADSLVKLLIRKNKRLALAESVTSGLAAYKLTSCKGASYVIMCSIVCYSEEVKKELLGISPAMIKKYTCESMQVTEQLARNLTRKINADYYAAITGLASEDGETDKKRYPGVIFICVRSKETTLRQKKIFKGSPSEIKTKACLAMYSLIEKAVRKH